MSVYKFATGGDPNAFVFPTDRGWLYSVVFLNRGEVFKGSELLENNGLCFEMIFGRSPLDNAERGADPLVRPTILQILINQFNSQGVLPLYFFVCDNQNRQEAARAKLFTQWYEGNAQNDWELMNFQLQLPDETDTYYVGLFANVEHPNFASIGDAFQLFLENDLSSGKLVSRH
jgi:hypothetical protein